MLEKRFKSKIMKQIKLKNYYKLSVLRRSYNKKYSQKTAYPKRNTRFELSEVQKKKKKKELLLTTDWLRLRMTSLKRHNFTSLKK